ncbi:efflux RND transporter periplasmic adaptor subunit [Sphingobium sp. CAP-1]|uniref:efflux RND transporter periplasmic adaptor subunit n=1 Tax=Sphingobium sp. CAP-1 TaxID=2676077 RepID=UPI0012BB2FC8|nr:efflux RND transporter periplasmic adaptor subunit [Sphingobium sp. CAP-1]QGP79572.1 efflux RND transporter periplasmic adaptor subunit [Sphingobium sp. CAP-1]
MNRLTNVLIRSAATIILVIAAVMVATGMWTHYERSPWTRDGRVRADVVRVTPDISGLVTSVAVRDNQAVKAGDLLFVIDTPRYALALEQADAQIASAQASLAQARREARRDLALGDLVAAESHEQNVAKVETAQAALTQALRGRDSAALNLKRTRVLASVNGVVTNLDLHPGDYVGAGSQAMALIDSDSLRVEGYFEETKLPLICIGAPVTVRLMGETQDVQGRVDSIAYGINDDSRSNSDNLLPTVEPTFSWVRLAQRIPVRVRLEKVPAGLRLISGRTATVSVQPMPKDAKPGDCRHG